MTAAAAVSLAGLLWLVVSLPVAAGLGRAIRIADHRDHPTRTTSKRATRP